MAFMQVGALPIGSLTITDIAPAYSMSVAMAPPWSLSDGLVN